MSSSKTRGISIIRKVKVSVPNKKEPVYSLRQFRVRCNAAIPPDHKAFQNQFLYANEEEKVKNPS